MTSSIEARRECPRARLLAVTLLAATLGIATLVRPAVAQQAPSDSGQAWDSGSVALRVGTAHLGISELNQLMARNGRGSLPSDVATIGFTAHRRLGRFVLAGEADWALPRSRSDNGMRSALSQQSFSVGVGLVIVEVGGISIFPVGSVGLRRAALSMQEIGDFTFDEGLANPGRGVEMSSLGGIARTGLTAERRFAFGRTGPFSISVEGGVARPFGGTWTTAGENRVTAVPGEKSGSFFRLGIGRPLGKGTDFGGRLGGLIGAIFGL